MILVTGSSGFIGSHIQAAVDASPDLLHGVIHMAAVSDTTCKNQFRLQEANVRQTLGLADACLKAGAPFIYASSASVYGNGRGPLNAYAESKAAIDAAMSNRPGQWYGARFFNVYGKGDEKKGEQASMVTKAFANYGAGITPRFFTPDARRDYIHVSDVVNVVLWLLRNLPASGVYDVGTGESVSIREMCSTVAAAMDEIPMRAQYGHFDEIETPPHMIDKCQMNTRADLTRLRAAGYAEPFLSLSDGVKLL